MECVVFPKTLIRYRDVIAADSAVFVEGNLSIREDEPPKLLVSTVAPLVDNAHFNGQDPRKTALQSTPAPKSQKSAQSAPKAAYNPYESMPAAEPQRAAYNPYESMLAAEPAPKPKLASAANPKKLYLRVPARDGELCKKALNLAAIFCDGDAEVILYDIRESKYFATGVRMSATPFVLSRLSALLGEENVVAKA